MYVTASLPEGVGEKVVSLTAASGKQIASWDREKEQGLFTHHLLDALYGGGDADGDGHVTASEAKAYLDKYMTRAARRQHRRVQEASLLGSEGVVLAAALVDGVFPTRGDPDDPAPIPEVVEPEDDSGDADKSASVLDLAAVTGGDAILKAKTTPPGAAVLLDNVEVGRTPLKLSTIRTGTYTVTLNHPTHETVVLEDQILASKRVLSIERRLDPATGSVTVMTEPEGAWVEHGGNRVGDTTPLTLDDLPSGPLVLKVGAAGHRPERVEVVVPKGGVILVERELDLDWGRADIATPPPEVEAALEPSTDPSAPTPEALQSSLSLNRDELRRIQRNLISLGLYVGPADGLFGKDTRRALKEWQSSQKMAATGYLDVDSAKALLAVQPETSITVRTVPPNANVRVVTASGSEYRDGMLVKPGEYDIAVDAPDHEPFRKQLQIKGPTVYEISLCKLDTKMQTNCEDSPVQRTINVASTHEETYEGTGQAIFRSFSIAADKLDASTYLLKTNPKEALRQFCSLSEQRARDDAVRQCERRGGQPNRDTFRVIERKCSNGRSPSAKVTGTMVCTFSEVVQQTHTEMVRKCSNEETKERTCPKEIVTRLR